MSCIQLPMTHHLLLLLSHLFINPGIISCFLLHLPNDSCCHSSQLYQVFDTILVLSHGHALYSGPGSFTPVHHLARTGVVQPYQQGYNVADYLLEVASDPPLALLQSNDTSHPTTSGEQVNNGLSEKVDEESTDLRVDGGAAHASYEKSHSHKTSKYAATFLTQLQHLSGREWKILRRWIGFF